MGGADAEPMLPVRGDDVSPAKGRGSPRDDDGAEECSGSCCCCGIISAVLLAVAALLWLFAQYATWIQYSVAITGVSGLDPATDLRQASLNPVFNLTVGLSSPSAVNGGCIGPGTSIKVSYSDRRVPMAGGRAPEMCVKPWGSVGPLRAVAGGHDVTLPGFLVDSLAEDMRRGDAVFEVKLTVMEDPYWKVVTCWARLGDVTGAALNIPCRENLIQE